MLVLKNLVSPYKKMTAPSYKMLQTKKTNTLIGKTTLVLQILENSCEKRHGAVSETKKTNTPVEKTILVFKNLVNSYEIHVKKGRSTALQNASNQKTNTLVEKAILVLKNLINSYAIHMKTTHSTVLQNASDQKNKHSR